MKLLLYPIAFFLSLSVAAQQSDSIKLHFLYGSVPAKGYKKLEKKHFGGIKGGHVNIEANGRILDFLPGNCPILPENRKPTGGFKINPSLYWDTATTRWLTIQIPVTREQLVQIEALFDVYSEKTPYDYAVFGVRCAAATYDVLSEIGIVKKLPLKETIIRNFYPKLLRKRMVEWARENNYPITYHEGKASRKWESDKGFF